MSVQRSTQEASTVYSRKANHHKVSPAVCLHLRQFAEFLPQLFGFCHITVPNRPFKQKVGALDLLNEVVSLRHCYSVELPFNRCVVDLRLFAGRFELHDDRAKAVVAACDGDAGLLDPVAVVD